MKNKGFTLIELLAVIVILAIIALITTPTILGVVEKSKKGAAEASALGYIDAIEKQIAMDNLEGTTYTNRDDYVYDEIKINIKGSTPTGGLYSLNNNKIIAATFCINDRIVEYSNDQAKAKGKCVGEDLKLAGNIKLSKTVLNISYPKTDTVEVLENISNGKLTCETSDSSVATCSIENNIITLKSGKKEGNSTITITSEGNSKYKEAKTALLVVTSKGLLSFTANGYENEYDGQEHGITVKSQVGIIKYGIEDGTYNLDSSPKYSDVGEYKVYYSIEAEGYKTVTGSKSIIIKQTEGNIKLKEESGTISYGNEKQIDVMEKTGKLSAFVEDNSIASVKVEDEKLTIKGLKVGTTNITIKSGATHNYKEVSTIYKITVIKANNVLTLSANTGSITYPKTGTFTVTKNQSGGKLSCKSSNTSVVTCSVSGTTITLTPGTTASNATITVTSSATENYNEASAKYVVTNNLGTLSVTANGYNGIWNNAAHGITVTSSGATIRYGTTSGTYNLTSSPTYKNVGTYTVYYQVSKAGYKTVTGSRNVTITPAYAQVGNNYYSTIQSAIDSNSGGTIVVLNNITESPTSSGKNFAINLNGKTVYGTITNGVYGTMSISNGTVSSSGAALANTVGTLTVHSGTYIGTYGVNDWNGTVTIYNGTFTGSQQGLYTYGGTVTVGAGIFTGGTYDGLANEGGNVTINGGSFTGTNFGIFSTNGTLTLNGGYARGNTLDGARKVGGTCNLNAISLSGHNWGGTSSSSATVNVGNGWQLASDQGWVNAYGASWGFNID